MLVWLCGLVAGCNLLGVALAAIGQVKVNRTTQDSHGGMSPKSISLEEGEVPI